MRLTITDLISQVELLENAIRKHRDQKGDDRCWLDDQELYSVLNEPIPESAGILPTKEIFLGNCEKYYQCRKKSDNADPSMVQGQWITREELELMEMRIRDKISSFLRKEALKSACKDKLVEADKLDALAKIISSPISLAELLQ